MKKAIMLLMPDGSIWSIPMRVVAEHRARYYAQKDHIPVDASLKYDTEPLFVRDPHEAVNWLNGHMTYKDFEADMEQMRKPLAVDYSKAWLDAEKRIAEVG